MARVVPARDSRVRVTQTPDGLRVDVGRRRRWWRVAIVAWIACVFGFGLIAMLTSEPPEDSGGGGVFVLWGFVGVAAPGARVWGVAVRGWVPRGEVAPAGVRRA